MLEVVYWGFDGLDVAFQGALRRDLVAILDEAKARAQAQARPVLIEYRAARFVLAETGAPNGYAFRCDSGHDGAIWFFKRGMSGADWNIRVSVKSLALALYGLGGVRARLYAFLADVCEMVGVESIGRVDYAVDVLAPHLVLVPEYFVMHSHTDRRDHIEPTEMEVGGKSSRVTSVTVGHMPRRQIIVYDKRAEVVQKHKVHWWEIWNEARRLQSKPELDPTDGVRSRVWRVEVRVGKDHLWERWRIRRWSDLDEKIGDVLSAALAAIRYALPGDDTNRSRWANHLLWDVVANKLTSDLFEMTCGAQPSRVKQVMREHLHETIAKQIIGSAATLSIAAGVPDEEVRDVPDALSTLLDNFIRERPERFQEKRARAAERYDFSNLRR